MDETTMTFRIPKALLERLRKLAKADERSTSYILRKAAEEYLDKHHKGGK
jgi:predicted transcriptional regulator